LLLQLEELVDFAVDIAVTIVARIMARNETFHIGPSVG